MTALSDLQMESGSELHLAEDFAAMARAISAADDLDQTLSLICSIAVERLPGRCHAGVSVVETGHRVLTRGATDPLPETVDRAQYETGQGPCLDALRDQIMVLVPDLQTDSRWPEFASRAVAETGVRSMMSFRLATGERVLGSLNLYSGSAGAFRADTPVARWGRVYAAHASVALAGARTQADMRAALESRETISVAIGLLMAREGASRQEAFDILRRASQRMNVKLRDVAARVAGGEPCVLSPEKP